MARVNPSGFKIARPTTDHQDLPQAEPVCRDLSTRNQCSIPHNTVLCTGGGRALRQTLTWEARPTHLEPQRPCRSWRLQLPGFLKTATRRLALILLSILRPWYVSG